MSASKIFGSFENNDAKKSAPEKEKHQFSKDGRVRISEEVIAELASQALMKVIGVQPDEGVGATSMTQGVAIKVDEEGDPSVVVDAYVKAKYGLRIPDIAWYVQESIRNALEQNTGYDIKAVNVMVKGLYYEDVKKPLLESPQKEKDQLVPPVVSAVPPVEAEKPAPEEPKGGAPAEDLAPKKERPSIFGRIEKDKP